jgi:hypothetical protein
VARAVPGRWVLSAVAVAILLVACGRGHSQTIGVDVADLAADGSLTVHLYACDATELRVEVAESGTKVEVTVRGRLPRHPNGRGDCSDSARVPLDKALGARRLVDATSNQEIVVRRT